MGATTSEFKSDVWMIPHHGANLELHTDQARGYYRDLADKVKAQWFIVSSWIANGNHHPKCVALFLALNPHLKTLPSCTPFSTPSPISFPSRDHFQCWDNNILHVCEYRTHLFPN